MISVVIPIKSESKYGNTELVYALRSLQDKLKLESEVFICGEKINSLQGLKYIHCKDEKGKEWKERNIYRKILAACNDDRVSENFIFMNDDHYLLEELETIPYLHKGELMDTMKKANVDYRRSLNHSRKYLLSQGKPTLDYDTHFPIIYNKRKFSATFVCMNWEVPFGYVIKSIYCNINGVPGEYGGDYKIHVPMKYHQLKERLKNKKFFSTADGVMNTDMIKLLNELYGRPSSYEEQG